MKIAFAGTPVFAAVALEGLLEAGFEVSLVLTQPDRAAGRGLKPLPSPVKQVALAHGIAVDQPERLRTPAQQAALRACAPDVLVVAAYGLLLPQDVLDLPRHGCLNIHASLLPRWRGAAPIHRAIEAGDRETGIALMQMDAGLDTGAIVAMQSIAIEADDTTASLHDKLARLGAQMLCATLPDWGAGRCVATPQPADGLCYAHKIGKHEAQLDWRRPAAALERAIRAFNPFPVAQAQLDGVTLRLWAAKLAAGRADAVPGEILAAGAEGVTVACGDGALCLTALQRPGSRRLEAADFLRGFGLQPGQRFSLPAPPPGPQAG